MSAAAAYLKTGRVDGAPALNRTARRQGRAASRHARTRPRPIEDRIEIAVPAIVDEDTFAAAARRLEDNRRFSARNTKEPSLLMGLVSCHSCGYAYYRTSTRTKKRKLYYYRCLGSDDYRYEHGRICENQPVRADYLDELVWGQVTALLADPGLVQAELDRRLAELRAANPATAERSRLELELNAPPRASSVSSMATRRTCSPSTSCGHACPTCAPKKPACADRSPHSKRSSSTATPT